MAAHAHLYTYEFVYVYIFLCIIKRVFKVYFKRKKTGACDFLAVRYYFRELSNSGHIFSGGAGFRCVAAAGDAVVAVRVCLSVCVHAPGDSVNEDAHARSVLMYTTTEWKRPRASGLLYRRTPLPHTRYVRVTQRYRDLLERE